MKKRVEHVMLGGKFIPMDIASCLNSKDKELVKRKRAVVRQIIRLMSYGKKGF